MKTVWIINQDASTPDTGVGGRSYYLGKELAKKGYRVYVIASASHHLLHVKKTVSKPFTLETDGSFSFVWVRLPGYSTAHSKMRVFNWFLFAWRICHLNRVISHMPDVILCSSPSLISFIGAHRLAVKLKARLVFEVRDIWPLTLTEIGGYSAKHPFIRFLQWVEDKAYRDSDAVISNLKNAVHHMTSRGMPFEKFTWIPNGFSNEEAVGARPLDSETLQLIPKAGFLVGYTGTFGLANDIFTLLDAAAMLKDYPDIHFILVGGGKDKIELVEYAQNLNLANVIFIDFVEKKQIQSVLAHFDVLTVGAKNEPMYRFGVSPNKLFDYFASGKPIIYHISSGDYCPVSDAGCGYEVEPQNAVQLSTAILRIYQMPETERELMGAKGLMAAVEHYEYSQLAIKLEKVLFQGVLSSN